MKKIFFIHIGKTAGSSLNLFLEKNFSGVSHCETYLIEENKLSNIEYLKNLDFISGHLKLSVFYDNNFSKEDYFLLTFLREPIDHLISHINWIMYLKDMSPFSFEANVDSVKKMSIELRESNLYDADVFIEKLNKFAGLFQNNQSKYFIRNDNEISSEIVISNMEILDMVGITKKYKKNLKKLIKLNKLKVNPTVEIINKNPSPQLNRDILNNKVIYDFILKYQSVDLAVYQHFVKK